MAKNNSPHFTIKSSMAVLCCLLLHIGYPVVGEGDENAKNLLDRAVRFMMDEVSHRGGFVMLYSEDLSRRWGELPARETMIWVQNPATVGVGETLLRAYQTTGDPSYFKDCERVASALIHGQHPSGGWHYFIDFEPARTAEWYETVGSKCWGWEEFYYHHDNCTFDDSVTVDAARFLLHLYEETGDPVYKEPLEKSLNFITDAQYANGAWPQRYPLDLETHSSTKPGYTAYYTYNDDIILGNIRFLIEAYQSLGQKELLDSAKRGMNFVLLSQLPPPQAGWAQQYSLDLQPAAARSYEPVAISTLDTVSNIRALEDFYLMTGDRRYLNAIPAAIRWLESSTLPKDHSEQGHTHATFIDIGTNRPIYGHREGTSKSTGRYWNDFSPENLLRGYGYTFTLDTDSMWKEYQRISKVPEDQTGIDQFNLGSKKSPPSPMSNEDLSRLIETMDSRGAWVEDASFPNTDDYMNNPAEEFRGIRTSTFLRNADLLINHIAWLNVEKTQRSSTLSDPP